MSSISGGRKQSVNHVLASPALLSSQHVGIVCLAMHGLALSLWVSGDWAASPFFLGRRVEVMWNTEILGR